jgi:hypothetical protein
MDEMPIPKFTNFTGDPKEKQTHFTANNSGNNWVRIRNPTIQPEFIPTLVHLWCVRLNYFFRVAPMDKQVKKPVSA